MHDSSADEMHGQEREGPSVPPLVDLRGVSKIYGTGPTEVRALDRVDLQINEREFVAIMGASGSGKSTCMNVLGCLDAPTSGAYFFRGVDVAGLSRDEQALLRRHYLGFVFQGFNLLPRTPAIENVELPLIYLGVRRAKRVELAQRALADVGLRGREHHTPAQLSGGQQQRVAIARALVTSPRLLLADEPTGNLDSTRKGEIMDLLHSLNEERKITIAMVTHEPEMAKHCSRIVSFKDGAIEDDSRWKGTS